MPLPVVIGLRVAQGQPFVGVRLLGAALVVLLEGEFYPIRHLFDAESVGLSAAVGTCRVVACARNVVAQEFFGDAVVADALGRVHCVAVQFTDSQPLRWQSDQGPVRRMQRRERGGGVS